MKVENLVLAKCIKNIDPWSDKNTGLEIGKYYVIEEINIGQSKSSIKINGKSYNSILFEYYNDYLEEIDIYKSYFRRIGVEWMNNEVKYLIIDHKGNVVPFDILDIDFSVKEIVSRNIKEAKRYTTKKDLFNYLRKFLKGENNE